MVVCVAVSVDWQHVCGLVAAEAGGGRRRGGLAEGERGAAGEGAPVFRGGRQDDWLAALLLEEGCGGLSVSISLTMWLCWDWVAPYIVMPLVGGGASCGVSDWMKPRVSMRLGGRGPHSAAQQLVNILPWL